MFVITIILVIITVNHCFVCGPSSMVLWWMMCVPGQAVVVAAADSADTTPGALVIWSQPNGGKQQAAALAVRVVVVTEVSTAVDVRCYRYIALGDNRKLVGPVSRGGSWLVSPTPSSPCGPRAWSPLRPYWSRGSYGR